MVTRGWGMGGWGDIGQRVQSSSYKMIKLWGSNVQHSDYSSLPLYHTLSVTKTVDDLKYSHSKEE